MCPGVEYISGCCWFIHLSSGCWCLCWWLMFPLTNMVVGGQDSASKKTNTIGGVTELKGWLHPHEGKDWKGQVPLPKCYRSFQRTPFQRPWNVIILVVIYTVVSLSLSLSIALLGNSSIIPHPTPDSAAAGPQNRKATEFCSSPPRPAVVLSGPPEQWMWCRASLSPADIAKSGDKPQLQDILMVRSMRSM